VNPPHARTWIGPASSAATVCVLQTQAATRSGTMSGRPVFGPGSTTGAIPKRGCHPGLTQRSRHRWTSPAVTCAALDTRSEALLGRSETACNSTAPGFRRIGLVRHEDLDDRAGERTRRSNRRDGGA
jgi:hypothetical protein